VAPQPVGKSIDLLRSRFLLDGLLGLSNFKRVTLLKHQVSAMGQEVLEKLAKWLNTNIKDEQGKGPVVTIR